MMVLLTAMSRRIIYRLRPINRRKRRDRQRSAKADLISNAGAPDAAAQNDPAIRAFAWSRSNGRFADRTW